MIEPFDGMIAKIDRSEKHLRDLYEALATDPCMATNVNLLSVENQPEGRLATCSVQAGYPAPDFGLYLGDAVHNLRSSLDHLIYQLAIAAGNPSVGDRTQFPIYAVDTPKNRKRIDRMIKPISPDAQSRIKALQPYERRPLDPCVDPLWILSGLDNIDKHRLLLVAIPKFATLNLTIGIDETDHSVTVSDDNIWNPLKHGTEPLRFRFMVPYDTTKPETEVNVKAQPTISIVFDETGLKCDGCDIDSTIRFIIDDVRSIVHNFKDS